MGHASLEVGIVCGRCETFSQMGEAQCTACGHDLSLFSAEQPSPRRLSSVPVPANEPLLVLIEKPRSQSGEFRGFSGLAADGRSKPPESQEEQMDQARYYVCESCMTPVPSGHKFCGRCGAPVPDTILHMAPSFYSDMQDAAKARLILIRGEGMDGLSYHLKADQHVIGRQGQLEFPDDPFISPKHANFFYRDNRLIVRDEGSLNGVYFRVRGSVEVSPGDTFLAGEQLFRLDPTPKASDGADPDGTFFYSSPKYPSAFRLNQILEGGAIGMTVCARGTSLQIGREDGDLNFPSDVFLSGKHCTVEEKDGKFVLTDWDSRNGTYLRIKTDTALTHGDYVFIGRKLLRVELNSN
jgi:pSer/pThr/pTyr-binding forkhead associated (FHA) protein